MNLPKTPAFATGSVPQPAALDPRLQPTPDYGTLGPGSDFAAEGLAPARPSINPKANHSQKLVLAAIIGIIINGAIAFIMHRQLTEHAASAPAPVKDIRQIDHLKPQDQAEALLELAVGRTDGAVDQISSRVDQWQGHLRWDSKMASLTTSALNSNDMRVRESGVQVELVAYNLPRNSGSLDYLVRTASSSNHAQKIWALWSLGLMGNRGVDSPRVISVLTSHLNDTDEDSRRWAVEGLGLVGTTPVIVPLLHTMHDDPSPLVRERAACTLAESGMFTSEQRLTAVPQLLNYSDDPSLDAQTHAWAFHALNDITQQHLPADSTAWRNWYNSSRK